MDFPSASFPTLPGPSAGNDRLTPGGHREIYGCEAIATYITNLVQTAMNVPGTIVG
jgi:hypothetical protein